MSRPTRLESLGHLLQAMMVVILNGPDDEPNADIPRVTPLAEEFADLFETNKKFIGRIWRKAFTDLRGSHENEFFHLGTCREALLRRTAIMPSVAIKALSQAVGCGPTDIHGVTPYLHRTIVSRVARETGSTEQFLRLCWRVNVDLDQQWHTLRIELLKVRAALAAPPTRRRALISEERADRILDGFRAELARVKAQAGGEL
jgi:hypothetical protein